MRARASLARWAVLALILVAFAALKLEYDPEPIGHHREDANFYYQIAQHVTAGEGLRTSVSLYHKGLRELPARITIYPLWPLVLGGAGAATDLERAATLLPELLLFVDLLLLYAVANLLAGQIGSRPAISVRGVPVVDLGHLSIAVLGTHRGFFAHTSGPWTEGLAFCMALGSLLSLGMATRGSLLPRAAAAGALASLAYLTRSQMLALPFAVTTALLVSGLADRRYRRAAAVCAGAGLLAVTPWLLFLASFVDGFNFRMFLDWTAYRETPELAPYAHYIEFPSLQARLASIADGLRTSLGYGGRHSYARSFGASVYLVPLAVLASAGPAWRRGAAGLRALAAPRHTLATALTLAGVGMLAPIHLQETVAPFPWWFHWRHGLPMIFLIVVALGALLSRGRLLRGLALAVVAASLVATASSLPPDLLSPRVRPFPGEEQLIGWLDAQDPPPVVLTSMARPLAIWSDAEFHWIHCNDDPQQVTRYFEHLPVDYLVVYPANWRCRFLQGPRDRFERVEQFGAGRGLIEVLRLRRVPGVS